MAWVSCHSDPGRKETDYLREMGSPGLSYLGHSYLRTQVLEVIESLISKHVITSLLYSQHENLNTCKGIDVLGGSTVGFN